MFSKNPRCQIVPLPNQEVAIGIDGKERLRWHASTSSPRPFFFPLIGPAGLPLTRMGHPGAPNHDHHRSIWFAHHKVLGISFWSDESEATIRQEQWLAYEDGEDEAKMAVRLRWYDGHDPQALIEQELIATIAPDGQEGLLLELQTSLWSLADSLELGKTNFGLLAVRVAKSLSAVFGNGVLTGANGQTTEKSLFERTSPWIDYSGSIDKGVVEGITYFDHPDNGTFPSTWHVRDDGWMGASVCGDAPVMLTKDSPTTWRYLLHAHGGGADIQRSNQVARAFHAKPKLVVAKSIEPHHAAKIQRT
ncbi:MAG: PmoA family protein [Rubripirellula sp.]